MNRIYSIDTVRFIAIIAVIAIHTHPFINAIDYNGHFIYKTLFVLINQTARFAVPFFFIMSGFFFAMKIKKTGNILLTTLNSAKRIAAIWLFFTILYLFPYDVVSIYKNGFLFELQNAINQLKELVNDPLTLIFEGSKVHLWFLVSLVLSFLISGAFLRVFGAYGRTLLIVFSCILFVIALLAKPYQVLDLWEGFNFRNGPFFGLIFFVMGYVLSDYYFRPRHLYYGLGILLFGFLVHFGEITFLKIQYGANLVRHDFVFGTLLVGLGAALVALSRHRIVNNKTCAKLGTYTLGVYGIHYIFADIFRPFTHSDINVFWSLGEWILVWLLSLIVTILMSKSRYFRHFFV